MHNNTTHDVRSVLASLRALIPVRALEPSESLVIAELQANRLLSLSGVTARPVPDDLISNLPRIQVLYRDLPTSGMSYWDGRARSWVICLNRAEPLTRQRFTLLHEYKHIIDHGHTDRLYVGTPGHDAARLAEQTADYFAGCALMSKRFIKRAWGQGMQRTAALAAHFDVSPRAMEVRLAQLGLSEPRQRCAPPSTTRPAEGRRSQTYYRQLSSRWPTPSLISLIPLEGLNVRS